MSKVWLVTGSASGLGRNITEAVLASGARLVATARDPRRLDDVVKEYGDQVRTALLDVADENAANSAVQAAVARNSLRIHGHGQRTDSCVNQLSHSAQFHVAPCSSTGCR